MTTIGSILNPYAGISFPQELRPVQPVSKSETAEKSPQRQQPQQQMSLTQFEPMRGRLEVRADLLQQRSVLNDGISARNRLAISSYRSLEDREERDLVSTLLGVDEYA